MSVHSKYSSVLIIRIERNPTHGLISTRLANALGMSGTMQSHSILGFAAEDAIVRFDEW
jgi:hypothetical protein